MLITWYLSRLSKEQAIKHAEDLRLLDKKTQFSENIHLSLDNLFKSIQNLRLINLQRKTHEDWSKETDLNSVSIRESGNSEAIKMQHDLTKWHLESILNLDAQHGAAIINVTSAQTRVKHLLNKQTTANIDILIKKIRSSSAKAGGVTEAIVKDFVDELNILILKIETNPEEWINS